MHENNRRVIYLLFLIYSPPCVLSHCLSYCFTTSSPVEVEENQLILVPVIFHGLLCEKAVLGDNREEDGL